MDDDQTPIAENFNDPKQATKLEQFWHLMKHHGQDLADYIITLRQHTNDALNLNEEVTGLVTWSKTIQDDLQTVKADLAGTCFCVKKQGQELAMAKKELKEAQEQLKAIQAEGTKSVTSSKSSHHPSKPKWPDAPIFTNGVSPTFEAWAQKIVQKTNRTHSNPQDQIDYACAQVGGQDEVYLAP